MKKLIIALLVVLISTTGFAQKDNNVTIGKIDSLQSKILGEQRKVWVYVPSGAAPQQKYPVVYLLDGDAHFYSVVGMIQQLSQVNGNTVCPEMIVVGIPNTDRTRDLTPTHIDADPPFMDSAFAKTSGGGEQFMSFIEKELMPYIEATYPTQPYKMLIGHSFGGLTVMNTVINHTKLFNSYICIDPSMWWDDMKFLETTKKALSEKDFTGTSLYVGIANTMDEGMTVNEVMKDTTNGTRQIRSILDMDNYVKTKKPKGLKYGSKYYENDDHGSAPLITEYDGLRFIFEKYRLNLTMKDYVDSTVNLADKYKRHYKEVSKFFGFEVKPPDTQINELAYYLLGMKHYKKAEGIFKMNMDNYPNSYNVYDSYGDYLIAIGDKANAIIQLKKALAIKENDGSRKKLNDLEGVIRTATKWGIIGTATPNNWDADQPMTYNEASKTWKITLNLKAGEFKFRANSNWNMNLGDTKGDGVLKSNGDNLKLAADGYYTVWLILNVAGNYTYKLVKN